MTRNIASGAVGELLRAAGQRLGTLTNAEKKMMLAAVRGDTLLCGSVRPRRGEHMTGNREIRSEVLRWLLVDDEAKCHVDTRGVKILGAKIIGPICLSHSTITFPLRIIQCLIEHEVDLSYAQTRTISLVGSNSGEIRANRLSANGDIQLGFGFSTSCEVQLMGARITGAFERAEVATSASLKNQKTLMLPLSHPG